METDNKDEYANGMLNTFIFNISMTESLNKITSNTSLCGNVILMTVTLPTCNEVVTYTHAMRKFTI